MNKSFAVVCDYNDLDSAVYLFDFEDDAIVTMQDFVHECFKNCVSNKRVAASYDFSEGGMRGTVKEHRPEGVREHRFFVAKVYR